ncbi:elongation factor P [Wolbachia endosymbiont of Howardula sp.]|uniref:elongation factor P n=1 Tax=Wolbachia endosymbiont of Howardula sp. TaxID=2916816 RepID=UPI00217D29DA|nr:elongation factor P [Wolbachia endosymbiont of Howardula sp.]UWI83279.1 elongation factor P [Wolbachia endosymbiont of Howardula sp.]
MADKAHDIRIGQILEHHGCLFLVINVMHTKPGKGVAYIQAEMKNIITKNKHYARFRSDAIIRIAILNEEDYIYLFTEGKIVHLMHMSDYQQIMINKDLLGDKQHYLQDNMNIKVTSYQERIIAAYIPDYVILIVKDTEERRHSIAPSYKSVILENGMRITVPQFIKIGDTIVVYTPNDSYHARVR